MRSAEGVAFTRPEAVAPGAIEIAGAVKNVALVGFGTVGSSVAKLICAHGGARLRLTHVVNRNIARKRVEWAPRDLVWSEDFEAALGPDVDIVVELIGGLHPAKELVLRAIEAGKPVVTANKQLIATYGPELFRRAREAGVSIAYGASVCGGMPVLPALGAGLGGDRIVEVKGILNGTCNYILSRVESEGVSFSEALAGAQELGYAEADPTDDVEGYDARAKLAILIRTALRREANLPDIQARGIGDVKPVDFIYARRIGRTIRQISRAKWDGEAIAAWVQPALVPLTSASGTLQGSRNVVVTTGEFGGDNVFSGFGAGGDPTAVAVVSDLVAIANGGSRLTINEQVQQAKIADDYRSAFYVRFVIDDQPGILAALAAVFAKHGINIDSVLQERGFERKQLPFVITLERCRNSQLQKALEEIANVQHLVEKPFALPIME